MESLVTDGLEQELHDLIVKICNVSAPIPDALLPDAPLIGPDSSLGLDSLDAVEIVVAVQKEYGVHIDAQLGLLLILSGNKARPSDETDP
ncbi:MAG: acyl carrier protein [Deltaproteobacteria bacterium]|nr:acyl carrier protein [Deltaproteobacteria bacterium]